MIFLGVDPGQVTGLAWFDVDELTVTLTAQQPTQTAVLNVWDWLDGHAYNSVEVVCERYVITQRTLRGTRQYDALHVAGAVRFKCQQLEVPYYEYPAAQSKRLAHDERLQELGLWKPGRGHVNDATRQVLTHLAHTRPGEFTALLDRSRVDG